MIFLWIYCALCWLFAIIAVAIDHKNLDWTKTIFAMIFAPVVVPIWLIKKK